MAENNRPEETEAKHVLDFGEHNAKDDNNENVIRELNLNSKNIYILHLYEMSHFEYILQWLYIGEG